jgi:hypothetical protein
MRNAGTTTNSFGVAIEDITGTNQWAVYQMGTNDRNYFGGTVGIGITVPSVSLDVGSKTDAIRVPRGTTAQRPTGANGLIRYNNNSSRLEVYENNAWINMTSTGSGDNLGNHTATTSILAVTGTAATPSYSFSDSGNRGMYAVGTGGLAFSTASAERIQIDSTGKMGFNTAPDSALPFFFKGNLANDVLVIQNNDAAGADSIQFRRQDGAPTGAMGYGNSGSSGFANMMFLSSSNADIVFDTNFGSRNVLNLKVNGQIGINTSSPTAGSILDINGTGPSYSSLIVPRDSTANRPTTGINGMIRFNSTSQKFEVYQGLWMDMISAGGGGSSDNLGNHTATTSIVAVDGAAATPGYTFASGQNRGMYAVGTGDVAFSTASLERIRIAPTGNIGIGTANPLYPLHLENTITNLQDDEVSVSYINSTVTPTGVGWYDAAGLDVVMTTTGTASFEGLTSIRGNSRHLGGGTVPFAYGGQFSVNGAGPVSNEIISVYGYAQKNHASTTPSLYGGNFDANVAGGTVPDVYGTYARARTSSAGSAVTNSYAVHGITQTSSGTITNAYGGSFNILSFGGTITNGYGVHIGDIAGTNQFGVYQTGTNDRNYFAGRTGVGTVSPAATLDVAGTGAILVPRNTTASRPFGINGMIRFNTDSQKFEVYQGLWMDMISAGGGASDNLGNHTATSAILATTGTATTPSYTFNGDVDTGMWNSGTNQLSLSTGGTQRLRIDSLGRIGIGTPNPGFTFDVNGSLRALSLTGLDGPLAVSDAPALQIRGGNAGTYGSGGSVELIGGNYADTGSGGSIILSATDGDIAASHGSLQFKTSGVERMRVTSGVGIGTTSPLSHLDVAGTGAIIVPRATASQRPFGINGMIRYNTSSASLETYAGGTWSSLASTSGAAGLTASTTVTCTVNNNTCVATCPAGYFRSGCNAVNDSGGVSALYVYPSAGNSCTGGDPVGASQLGTVYAICLK